MLTGDDYGAIRKARRDGKSIHQITRDFNHSRNAIRLILQHAEPNPSPRNYSAPVLGPFKALIDQILVNDEDAAPKQRHTALQVFRRLRDQHGYPGCYGTVQRYLLKHQHKHKETLIPLGHLPGQRLEADFGHIHVDFPDGRRQIPFLVTAWAYSNAPFVLALPFDARRRSFKAWSGPSSSSAASPRKSGQTRSPLPRSSFKDANAGSFPAMPSWPATTSSIPLLHAGSGQREARRRGDRQGRATPLRHPGAPR